MVDVVSGPVDGDSKLSVRTSSSASTSEGSSLVGRLRLELRGQIAATVDSVCDDFARELEQSQAPAEVGAPSFDTYQDCCRQLVSYMAIHMTTSPGFAQEMEKVILASHSNTAGRVLQSLVRQDITVHYSGLNTSEVAETPVWSIQSTPMQAGPRIKADGTVTPSTRSPFVDLTVVTPPTVPRGNKRPTGRGSETIQDTKRPRHAVVRALYNTRPDVDQIVETISSEESETETEEKADGEGTSNVEWPCAGDDPLKRSGTFKRHLHRALRLVDALSCSPPSGMVCAQGCARLRSQMCEAHRVPCRDTTPCHDIKCSMWRIVDKHVVRCQESQCEFKNRVGLRMAMHIVQQKEAELDEANSRLEKEKSALRAVDSNRIGGFAATELEETIKTLEDACAGIADGICFQKEREQAFREDLSSIGVVEDDRASLPDFKSHYVNKPSRQQPRS